MTDKPKRKLTPLQRVVATVAAAYPVPAWAPMTLRTYEKALADLDVAALQAAALTWMQSYAERPTIADLRKAVAGRQATDAASPYLDPDEAWAHVEASITRVGGYAPFPDTHPLVAETVRVIGWRTLCQSDNPVADRAHFLQLYRTRLERARRDDAATPGAVPHAAMGERPSVVHQDPRRIEQRATAADARALVSQVAESIGRRPLPPPVVAVEAPTAEITDAAELERREARRRALLGRPAREAPPPPNTEAPNSTRPAA